MINEANEPSSACRLWRTYQVETSTPPRAELSYSRPDVSEQRRRGPVRMLLGQFTDFMIIVLILAGIVSGLVGEWTDTIAIVVIVVLNGVFGFAQEFRADRAGAALKRLASPSAQVLREGKVQAVAARDLVPGDLVLLEAGNVVPADLRLLDVARLKVEEAPLTGESLPVEKSGALLREIDSPLGDRRNMAYKGTIATYGRGLGVIIATGMATELGKIASLLSRDQESKTPAFATALNPIRQAPGSLGAGYLHDHFRRRPPAGSAAGADVSYCDQSRSLLVPTIVPVPVTWTAPMVTGELYRV